MFSSSTSSIPKVAQIPQHIAVIMDGNGRWAKKRLLPRIAGHKQGLESVRNIIKACSVHGVAYLTLFAFSTENWRRPADEVTFLMSLFMEALKREVNKLHQNNVRFKLIGDRSQFDPSLQHAIEEAEHLTRLNTGLVLTIAANYGGRWDILQAVNQMIHQKPSSEQGYNEHDLMPYLSTHDLPEPDLFIRTGGEQRVSNFMLWQLAYTEIYFTNTLWPDFDEKSLLEAFQFYQSRERRFGRTSEQLS
ncbi:MAG: isoprenyl transferase [Methylophilaceae bacterium]